jgi:lactoylglutathione lyase
MDGDPSTVNFEAKRFIWGVDLDKPRMLHLAIRVAEIDRSVRFYVDGLGMKLVDRIFITPANMTAVFVGYGDYEAGGLIELCRYWNEDGPYTHGTGFHHISVGVEDVAGMAARLVGMGFEMTVPPTDYAGKGPRLAYVKDPDGYSVELIQTAGYRGQA